MVRSWTGLWLWIPALASLGRNDGGESRAAAMPAHAGDLDHPGFRRKAGALCRRIETVGDRRGWRLSDRPAVLADQEHDRRVARVIMDAGKECVAALDAMHEALGGEKIERAIHRDRRGTRPARRD